MTLVDIIGYIGTGLVVASFLFDSLVKLRLLNAAGAFLVTIYAIMIEAWPVAILDGFIVLINISQIAKTSLKKNQP